MYQLDENHLFVRNIENIEAIIQDEIDKWQETFSFTDDTEELE